MTDIIVGFTPLGILVDAKDLLQDNSLGEFSLAALGMVPVVGDLLKGPLRGAVRGTKNKYVFQGLNEARQAAKLTSGIGADAVDFIQELGPFKGRVTGRMSPDGKRGWRLDYDDRIGLHINWWDWSEAAKRPDALYGANIIESGSQDQYWSLLQHLPMD